PNSIRNHDRVHLLQILRARCDSKGHSIPFFFSSRRRHTRCLSDWSSDVCSSDLFVFSDPAGKRWPRLRLILLIFGVFAFLSTVLFVQTLFVAPQMRVPFSLRQLKGQLKALQRANPAGQVAPSSLLWQKFGAAKQAAKKL